MIFLFGVVSIILKPEGTLDLSKYEPQIDHYFWPNKPPKVQM